MESTRTPTAHAHDVDPSPVRFWAPALGLVGITAVAASMLLWIYLPRWAPQWVLSNVRFADPAVRALAEVAEFEQVEWVDYECVRPTFELDPSWPMTDALVDNPFALEPLLRSEDERVRRVAAAVLKGLCLSEIPPELVTICVKSDDASVRTLGIDLIYQSEDTRLLSLLLADPEPGIRCRAVNLLGNHLASGTEFGSDDLPNVHSIILDGLESPFADVRDGCAENVVWGWHNELGERFRRDAFGPLVHTLGGTDTRTHRAAASSRALRLNGEPWGVVLAALLHADPPVRRMILLTIDREGADCLLAFNEALESPEPRLRASAALVLWEISPYPEEANLPDLVDRADPALRSLGIDWRSEEDRIELPTILGALRSEHRAVQRAGVRALANARFDPDPGGTHELCRALAAVDDLSARELLDALCEDPDVWIRDTARAARGN